MPLATAAVLDALIALYDAEQASLFRLMGEGSPYLAKAPDDVRRTVADVSTAIDQQGRTLATTIRHLGGTPPKPRPPSSEEEQYLGFLTLNFLLPKLVGEKQLCLQRFDNTLRAIGKVAPSEVTNLLRTMQEDNQHHLEALKRKSEEVVAASKA